LARKEFEVLFRINGALSSEFAGAMRAAQSQLEGLSRQARISALRQSREMQQLQGYLGNLQKKMADVGRFKQLKDQIAGTSNELVRARLRTAQLTQEYQNQKKQTDQMRQSLQRLKTVFKENKSSMSADQRATMQSQIRAAQQELRDQKEREKSALGNLTSHNTNTTRLQSRLRSQQAALRELQGSMSQAGVNVSQLASYESRLRAEIERTTQAIERQNQINFRRQETFDRHNQASQNLSNAYGNFQGATDTARSIMSPFKAAVDEAVTFEQSMSKLKALTQVRNIREGNIDRVNREMTAMGDTIKMLGDTTEFTRTEVAQAAQKYAMSGWNQEQINAVLQPTIDVATATGEKDVIKIADMLSDEMQAMGMKAGQQVEIAGKTYDAAKHWGDVFAYATNQSNVDATAFHEALKYNAPVGHAAGMTAHEIAAVNMTMANSAIKGSMSGTAMRSGILRILAPPKTAAKDLAELDAISMSDAQKQIAEASAEMQSLGIAQTDSWSEKLAKMSAAFKSMDRSQALSKMEKIFGKNAVSGWAAFFDTNSFETFQGYMKDLDSGVVDNWAKDTAEVMRDNTANKFALFESAMAGAANSVGTVFLPVISVATTMLTDFANSFGQWAEQNQTAVQWIGLLAAGISTVIVLASGAAVAFSAWTFVTTGIVALKEAIFGLAIVQRIAAGATAVFTAAQTVLNAVMMMNPIGLAVAAVVALGAALLYVATCCPQVSAALSAAWNDPQGAVHGFATLAKSLIDDAVNYIMARWETLKSALAHPIDAIINFMDHGDVLGGNVTAGNTPAGTSGGGSFGTPATPATPAVDTSQAQAQVNNLGSASDQAATAVQANAQSTQIVNANMQGVGEAVTTLQTSIAGTGEGITQLQNGMMTVNPELMTAQTQLSANNMTLTENNSALAQTSAGLQSFNAALSSTNGGLQSLSSSSSEAASAVSSLGSAASSAVSAMQSAAASAASAAAAKPAANAKGGIYNRGAFLTWFAEKSPEAAIPLDKSTRAISLWQRAGQMLGVLPKETSATFDSPGDDSVSARSPKYDELGNIIGLHGLKDNVITKADDIQVSRSKKAAQLDEWKRKNPVPSFGGFFERVRSAMDFLPSLPDIFWRRDFV